MNRNNALLDIYLMDLNSWAVHCGRKIGTRYCIAATGAGKVSKQTSRRHGRSLFIQPLEAIVDRLMAYRCMSFVWKVVEVNT